MPTYKIAELTVNMTAKYHKMKTLLKPYLIGNTQSENINIKLSNGFYTQAEKELPNLTKDEIENIYSLRQFSLALLNFNGFVLHASALVHNDKCYLFSGNSGEGKSTQTELWLKEYPNDYILNDDKPAIRIINNRINAYGTPWCGSTSINKNSCSPVAAVIFVSKSSKNSITRVTNQAKALSLFIPQTVPTKSESKTSAKLALLSKIISSVPIYTASLTNDNSAVTAIKTALNID